MPDHAFVVIPFERKGITIGPQQILMCEAPQQAHLIAQQLAQSASGVAILERKFDPETGADIETLVARYGAIPPAFPEPRAWSMRLN